MFKKVISVLLTLIVVLCSAAALTADCFAVTFSKGTKQKMYKFIRIRSYAELNAISWTKNVRDKYAFIVYPEYQGDTADQAASTLYDKLYCFYGLDQLKFYSYESDDWNYKIQLTKVKSLFPDFDINQDEFYAIEDEIKYLPNIEYMDETTDKTNYAYGKRFNLVGNRNGWSVNLWNETKSTSSYGNDEDDNKPGFKEVKWAHEEQCPWIFTFRDNTNMEEKLYHGDPDACKILCGNVGKMWRVRSYSTGKHKLDSIAMTSEYYYGVHTLQCWDRRDFSLSDDGTNAYLWIGVPVDYNILDEEKTFTVKSGEVLKTDNVTVIGDKTVINIEKGGVLDITEPTFCAAEILNYGTTIIRNSATLTLSCGSEVGSIHNWGNFEVAENATLALNGGMLVNKATGLDANAYRGITHLKGTLDLINDRWSPGTLLYFDNGDIYGYYNSKILLKTNYNLSDYVGKTSGNDLKDSNLYSISTSKSNDHYISQFLIRTIFNVGKTYDYLDKITFM